MLGAPVRLRTYNYPVFVYAVSSLLWSAAVPIVSCFMTVATWHSVQSTCKHTWPVVVIWIYFQFGIPLEKIEWDPTICHMSKICWDIAAFGIHTSCFGGHNHTMWSPPFLSIYLSKSKSSNDKYRSFQVVWDGMTFLRPVTYGAEELCHPIL